MPTINVDANYLKSTLLKIAIIAKAHQWGINHHAIEDIVARAMPSAQLDASTGELKNFSADVFLSGLAVDETTRHLLSNPRPKTSSNPVHGDLTADEFNALPPEERLNRANAVSFADKKRRGA